ncbi:Aste57867_15225 [Aphanomyces stellatus]|uniref:Aste57867_15225 protein n=1 Tax=Aphanomyces stellatus TaxID=120398 RepID=A0A485L3L9_9STRA|nr:hypothetical protein As57867_015169 [Aphanomyces stellatus]VFT92034.1 Aste57867_15225 [Aphanomyces stellatus]
MLPSPQHGAFWQPPLDVQSCRSRPSTPWCSVLTPSSLPHRHLRVQLVGLYTLVLGLSVACIALAVQGSPTVASPRMTTPLAPARAQPIVLIVGDSNTELSSNPVSLGWQISLSSDYVRRADVISRGAAGWSTAMWAMYLPTLQAEWASKPPALVLLMLGTLDASPTPLHIPIDEYRGNLETLVRGMQAAWGSRVLLLTPLPVDNVASDWKTSSFNQDAGTYAAAMLDVATHLHVPVLDLWTPLQPIRTTIFVDGLHLNRDGNVLVHGMLRDKIADVWPDLMPDNITRVYTFGGRDGEHVPTHSSNSTSFSAATVHANLAQTYVELGVHATRIDDAVSCQPSSRGVCTTRLSAPTMEHPRDTIPPAPLANVLDPTALSRYHINSERRRRGHPGCHASLLTPSSLSHRHHKVQLVVLYALVLGLSTTCIALAMRRSMAVHPSLPAVIVGSAAQVSKAQPVLLFVGDSNTEFAINPALLGWQASLSCDYIRRADIINRGAAGWNTATWTLYLPTLLTEWASKPPALVLVMLGTLDASPKRLQVPLQDYQTNLRTLVQGIQTTWHSRVLLATPLPVDDAASAWKTAASFNQNAGAYAAAMVDVAKDLNVPVLDLWTPLQVNRTTIFYDGEHLNQDGNTLVHAMLQAKIAAEFPDLVPTNITRVYSFGGL